ncbi:unnamed protein product [Moneuplotes crassus]|uniref:Uncharacterized protein n=1 Tax=Euplotes crassus TaxID=5936 RepID=A0AAD1XBB7_EUPCR|nr:unnamed protein product [Moneuplotes crassus]
MVKRYNEFQDKIDEKKEIAKSKTYYKKKEEDDRRKYTSDYLNFLDKHKGSENSRLFKKVLNIQKESEDDFSEFKLNEFNTEVKHEQSPLLQTEKKKVSTPLKISPRKPILISEEKSNKPFVVFQAKPLDIKFIENIGIETPIRKYISTQSCKQGRKRNIKYSVSPQKINFLRILPKKDWVEKNNEEREIDNQENLKFKKAVEKKVKDLHKEAARMFPYSHHGERITKGKIQSMVNRLDLVKDLAFLKGANSLEVMEKGLNEQEKRNITNSIMRKIKYQQLKKMRMSEFKRQVKIAQRKERNKRSVPKWTKADRVKQIKQHKKSFIDYIGGICTKKEETVVKNAEINISKQSYFLTKQEARVKLWDDLGGEECCGCDSTYTFLTELYSRNEYQP